MYVSWPTISIKKRQSKSGTQSLSWCDEGANGIPWQIASFTFLFENSQAWIGQKSDLIGLICLHATRLAIPPDMGVSASMGYIFSGENFNWYLLLSNSTVQKLCRTGFGIALAYHWEPHSTPPAFFFHRKKYFFLLLFFFGSWAIL